MAEPVIGAVLEKTQKYFTDNWELPQGAEEMVKKLANKLKDCQENVKEIEKIAIIENRALADWLRMLKDTVYDAEDVLDNMEATSVEVEDVLDNMEATSVEVKVQEKNKVRKIASSDENLESLKMVVDQLNKFYTDLPKIRNLVNMIENNELHTREVSNPRETISLFFGKMGLYGRQKELNQILEIILSSELKSSKMGGHGLLVIPIVGMGGVGKTALAQAVYNHPDVQQTFAKRAWISVSNNHDLLLVMSKIYQSLSEHPVSYLSQVPLEVDISKELSTTTRGVKLLIVLDNMFECQWDDLYTILSFASPGSVVLITTQNKIFANGVGTIDPIALSTLNSDTFLELFEHFAFGNKDIPEEKRIVLKSIGKKIANKLRGLPLSAKIIGNILRSNLDEDRWRKISKSEWWNIPEAKSQILPNIAIGYEQLDPCLRQCFAYCSLFPRKSLIEKDRLVHMWIAQNFIQCDVNGAMRLEDIGRQWFDELVKKSLFQRAGDNDSYVMHELMHDLAVIVSSGECFYLGEGLVEIPLGVRHLAVDTNNLEVIKGIKKHKNLRSLLYFGCCQVEGMYSAIDDTLSNLESIRVLDFSYIRMEYNSKPPPAIWNLQHLRFLDLSSTGIEVLPHSVFDLYHLQSLYIQKCKFRQLPKGINKLLNLCHLSADKETIAQISCMGHLDGKLDFSGVEFLVGGWCGSPVIKSVLEKAQKYLGANYKWQKGGKEMVDELIVKLLLCQATVKAAEKRAIINNQELAELLRMLKETVYDAEDVLDNIEAKSIKDEVQQKNQVLKAVSSSFSTVRNMVISEDNQKSLKEVVAQLNQYYTNIEKILMLVNMDIDNKKSQTHELTNPRETISEPLEEVGLYGRQDELDLILEIILSVSPSKSIFEKILGSQSKFFLEKIFGSQSKSSKKGEKDDNYHGIFVIPIVGMGGVGKTALAQAVYNNPEVQKQTFEKRAWISVSNNRDKFSVMCKIYESLAEYPVTDWTKRSLEFITEKISSIIQRDKFLIVLDDMFDPHWNFVESKSLWNRIHTTLSRGAPGSVVLITTQNQVLGNWVVGNTVGAVGPIALSALDSGVFWELFERFAFRNVSKAQRNELIPIGKIIADKLHGLPLAAKIIGNVLNSEPDEHKWRDISKSEWWHIQEVKSQILPSIGLGYEHLNPSLRQCFAYCSLFPRNSLIEKDRLVHMWIAQNFIPCDVNGVMRLEDIGRQWFDELVKKSLLQRAGDNDSYVMHELMHDLAVIVSSGECFYLGEGVESVDEIPLGIRHLAVDTTNVAVIRKIQNHKNLRSFLYFVRGEVKGMYTAIQDTLCHLDSIRVLDLSYMHMENKNKPPNAIWDLHHLRFLDLSFTRIEELYHSSIHLYHLQALYIRECKLKELPLGINKLINLRHLYAEEETIAQISGIGQLTNLQELGVFIVREERGYTITELENLREIGGTLIIKNFENIKNKDEAMRAKLVNKKHLDSIRIIGSNKERNSNKEVLQELQPNKNIKDLTIESYAGLAFPNWIFQIGDTYKNLHTLCLDSCFNVEVLPPLGELPFLKHLQIRNFDSVKHIDSHLYGKKQTVFPLLEVLVLHGLFNCEEWTDAGATEFFPHLRKLTMKFNETLRKAPLNLFSSTLKELEIYFCDSLILLLENCFFSLTRLELWDCSKSITFDPLNMPILEDLDLRDCPELKIQGGLQSLTHLKRLRLDSCPNLFSRYSTRDQQKGKGLQVHQDAGLRSLTHIEADHYSLLNHEYHLILGSLPSLRFLKFSGITQFTNNQNLWFEELTALQEIHFSNCKFEHLPASLTLLSSLKKMDLTKCTKLEYLSGIMPPNLQKLTLNDCSKNLVQRCQQNKGEDWHFISNIPVIEIDGTTISNPQISDETG